MIHFTKTSTTISTIILHGYNTDFLIAQHIRRCQNKHCKNQNTNTIALSGCSVNSYLIKYIKHLMNPEKVLLTSYLGVTFVPSQTFIHSQPITP